MKKLIAALLTVTLFVTVFTTNALALSASNFRDVPSGAWYYTAVNYSANEGLFSGTSANTFSPNTPMTRAMFVRVLGNKAKIDPKQYPTSSFTDVKAGTWYGPYVEWAAQNGIVSGIGGGKFAPNQSVTREQMAVILYNYARYAGCSLLSRAGDLMRFSDNGRISGYAWHPMEWAVTNNLLSGSGGRMDPKGTATRAQVAQIFYNSRNLLPGGKNETADPAPDSTPTPEPVPTPAPAPTAAPTPTIAPDEPRIPITDEVRAKLRSNQDPEKILDYVLNGKHDDPTFSYDGTTAKWDPSLLGGSNVGKLYLGSWLSDENEMRGSSVVANGFVQMLTHTASDRFYITAEDIDDCFCLYYHPTDKPDSQKMQQIKASLKLTRPIQYDSSILNQGSGWAGPMRWDVYGGAQGIAGKIEYYLLEMHPYATQYYLTEPEPGVFYLLY